MTALAIRRGFQVCSIVAIILFIWIFGTNSGPIKSMDDFGYVDFAVFYIAGGAMTGEVELEPRDLYAPKSRPDLRAAIKSVRSADGGTYILYPPAANLFFAPFSYLSIDNGLAIWKLLSAASLMGSVLLLWNLLNKPWWHPLVPISIGLIAFSGPIIALFRTGQVNSMILFLILGMLWLLREESRRSEVLAGIALGLATVLKVFPILFLPYLFLRKKWIAGLSTIITGIAAGLVSLFFFTIQDYRIYIEKILLPLSDGALGTIYKSISLYGSFRFAVHENFFQFLDIKKKALIHTVDPWFTVATIAIGLLTVWVLWKHRKNELSGQALLLDYGLIMLYFLLFSKNVQYQYALWTIPVIALLLLKVRALWQWLLLCGLTILLLYGNLHQLTARLDSPIKMTTIGLIGLFIYVIWWDHLHGMQDNEASSYE